MADKPKNNSERRSGQVIKNDIKNSDAVKINSKEKHAVYLMENLKELLDENLFCDVDLVAVDDDTK